MYENGYRTWVGVVSKGGLITNQGPGSGSQLPHTTSAANTCVLLILITTWQTITDIHLSVTILVILNSPTALISSTHTTILWTTRLLWTWQVLNWLFVIILFTIELWWCWTWFDDRYVIIWIAFCVWIYMSILSASGRWSVILNVTILTSGRSAVIITSINFRFRRFSYESLFFSTTSRTTFVALVIVSIINCFLLFRFSCNRIGTCRRDPMISIYIYIWMLTYFNL